MERCLRSIVGENPKEEKKKKSQPMLQINIYCVIPIHMEQDLQTAVH